MTPRDRNLKAKTPANLKMFEMISAGLAQILLKKGHADGGHTVARQRRRSNPFLLGSKINLGGMHGDAGGGYVTQSLIEITGAGSKPLQRLNRLPASTFVGPN